MPWLCVSRTAWVGVLPALGGVLLAGRAFALRPSRTAVVACLGGLGLGALVVQLSCTEAAWLHVVAGHVGGPLVVAAVLAVPSALWLWRRTRP